MKHLIDIMDLSIEELDEMIDVAKDIIGQSYDTSEALFLLVVAYAVILIPISALGSYVEGRFSHGR